MIPKRCRATCSELHTTRAAICNALSATAAHTIHCSTNRGKVVPDDWEAAATARPSVQHTDLCTLAENQPRTGVTPSVHPLAGVETGPLLHCLVHLRWADTPPLHPAPPRVPGATRRAKRWAPCLGVAAQAATKRSEGCYKQITGQITAPSKPNPISTRQFWNCYEAVLETPLLMVHPSLVCRPNTIHEMGQLAACTIQTWIVIGAKVFKPE